MQATTHILGGLLAGMALAAVSLNGPTLAVPTCAAAAASALFPDIDLCTSKVGYKTKPISFIISKLFGHRTLFHSPILYITLYLLGMKYFPQYDWVVQAFTAGVMSHLFLDMLNRKGIPIFYPISKRYHIATIKTGSRGETAVCIILAIAVMIGLVLMFSRIG